MRPNPLRARARQGQVSVNAWVSMGNGYLAEILGHAGFDAVTVDLQHGAFGFDTAVALLQALSSTPATPLARSAGATLAEINKLLDAGAYGIICPLIESVDEAAAFARACRYPPRGTRSFGPSRGLTYGGADYAAHADDEMLALAMIETLPALDQIDAILAVDELDGIYFGPSDMGLALGVGSTAWPDARLVQAIDHVFHATRRAGKYAGIFAGSVPMAEALARQGWDLVTPGNDAAMLRAVSAERTQAVRAAAGPRA